MSRIAATSLHDEEVECQFIETQRKVSEQKSTIDLFDSYTNMQSSFFFASMDELREADIVISETLNNIKASDTISISSLNTILSDISRMTTPHKSYNVLSKVKKLFLTLYPEFDGLVNDSATYKCALLDETDNSQIVLAYYSMEYGGAGCGGDASWIETPIAVSVSLENQDLLQEIDGEAFYRNSDELNDDFVKLLKLFPEIEQTMNDTQGDVLEFKIFNPN